MKNHFNAKMGFGTSNLAPNMRPEEWNRGKDALHYAIEVGYSVLDTAEQYGDGKSELIIGEVLSENKNRNTLHIVSKVLPKNAVTVDSIVAACVNSISRMQCDYIDTYLLHWRDPKELALEPIIEAFVKLKDQQLIKHYGVSNFNKRQLIEWQQTEQSMGVIDSVVTNQTHYSISARDPERYYLDWQREHNITAMAYSPLNNKRNNLLTNPAYIDIAARHGYDPIQLALAWVIQRDDVITIPTSRNLDHIESNFQSQFIKLSAEVLADIDAEFKL